MPPKGGYRGKPGILGSRASAQNSTLPSSGPLSAVPTDSQLSPKTTVTQRELPIVVSPPEVFFREYEPFKEYTATVSFQNQTTVAQNVRLVSPESRFFTLSAPKGGSATLKVAAGLSVTYTVRFLPEEEKDYSCELVCLTENHQFLIPVTAISARGTLDIPAEIVFDGAPVRLQSEKTLFVRNVGRKPAQFSLTTSEPWKILPTAGSLDPQQAAQFSLLFTPGEKRAHEGFLDIAYSNGDTQRKMLRGSVVDVNVKLEQSVVQIPQTFITLERQEIVRLRNLTDFNLPYQWKLFESAADEPQDSSLSSSFTAIAASTGSALAMAGAHLFEHPVFTIEPLCGELRARATAEFTVTFNPQMAVKYDAIAYLDVVGRAARLPLHLSGVGAGPQCCFSYDALDVGDVFINSPHLYEVMLENRGSIEARFQLQEQKTLFGSRFHFSPSFGVIQPGDSQVIEIRFCSDIIGTISEAFMFDIKGATNMLLLHFQGRVIGPTFHFDTEELDFGQVAFNFVHNRLFHIFNTSEIPMKYTLRVPEDGTGDRKEFTLVPSSGTILPHGKQRISVDFLSSTVQEYSAHVVVDVEEVGENLDALPVRAVCPMPQVSVSRESLDFGSCFIGYPYSLPVEVHNSQSLPAKYEVVLPSPEDPVRRKLDIDADPRKGVVSAKTGYAIHITITPKMVGTCHLPIYLRIPGSDRAHHPLTVSAKVTGPVVVPEPEALDFGSVPVLVDSSRAVALANRSPISASFTAVLENASKSTVFSLPVAQGTIAPESTFNLPVFAFPDEVMNFSDTLVLTILHTGDLKVPLKAQGKGITLVPSIPLTEVDFGNQFTTTQIQRTFVLSNRGRRPLNILWCNDRGTKIKEGEPPVTFRIHPERAAIPGKTEASFVVEGFSPSPGKCSDRFSCKLAQSQKVLFHPTVLAEFFTPLLQFSHPQGLTFTYVHERSAVPPVPTRSSQPLTLKNVSPLTLDFTLKAGAPFVLDRSEFLGVKFGESVTVQVSFDASHRGDRQTHVIKTKLTVVYKEHPQRDTVDLTGDVTFPNLTFDSTTVDFGCVLNDTDRSVAVSMTNSSKVDAVYLWVLEDQPRLPGEAPAGGAADISPPVT
eukprot:RCo033281